MYKRVYSEENSSFRLQNLAYSIIQSIKICVNQCQKLFSPKQLIQESFICKIKIQFRLINVEFLSERYQGIQKMKWLKYFEVHIRICKINKISQKMQRNKYPMQYHHFLYILQAYNNNQIGNIIQYVA
ncbi:hypothetical protein ABPG73_016349 [Tetrahymena malaccensis]